jgi:hypothetical protein
LEVAAVAQVVLAGEQAIEELLVLVQFEGSMTMLEVLGRM